MVQKSLEISSNYNNLEPTYQPTALWDAFHAQVKELNL